MAKRFRYRYWQGNGSLTEKSEREAKETWCVCDPGHHSWHPDANYFGISFCSQCGLKREVA